MAQFRKHLASQSGSIFIFAMTALAVLLILGVASVQIAMQGVRRASVERDSSVAFNLAEAGADAAEAWLRAQSLPPAGTATIDPLGGQQVLETGSYSAFIIPNLGNGISWIKGYTIVATGLSGRGQLTKQVVLKVQLQSFALYSYFTDQERSSVTNGTIWFYARDQIHGPVHSNDQFHIAWSTSASHPIFYDTVSSTNSSVDWDPRAPRNATEWRRVLEGGQDALTLRTDRIPLPASSDRQRVAAWGDESGFPTSSGVYVPTLGGQLEAGIYVVGNSTVGFRVEGSTGNQIIDITQGSTTTTITVDLAASQTKVADGSPGSPHTYGGVPNGVIYTTGHVTSLQGALANNYENGYTTLQRNAWTVATDVNAGKDITITGNLTYATQPDPNQDPSSTSNLRAPTLGLVAEDVVLASSCPNNLTLNAAILAGGENTTYGSFYNAAYNGALKGTLRVVGGIIQKKRGPVGMFNTSTDQATNGYTKDYNYDPRMVDAPPPFFPTTGQYDVKSWQYK